MGRIRTLKDRTPRDRARALRRDQTEAETRLWGYLRDRRLARYKWRRQLPIGPYIVDFCCIESGLVVELDGGQHVEAQAYDARRTAYLAAHGFHVVRFWNREVFLNREGVCLTLLDLLGAPSPPRGGR